MKRSLGGLVCASFLAAGPALAADYFGDAGELRPAYPENWDMGEDNPLRFGAGIRYWYSLARQEHQIGSFFSQTIDSQAHSGEIFARIDDDYTRTFVEATGAYGIAHSGTFSTNGGADVDLPAARLGYAGLDFGWTPFGDQTVGLGFVTGYQYTNDSPDTGRANFTTAETSNDIAWSDTSGAWGVGGDSEINNFDIHGLKLGLAGHADFGAFDISGEAAITPYAWVSGTYGAFVAPGQTATTLQASAATVNGFGYGASGKLMVGFSPTENLTIRVGGRASYLEGAYDATWDEAIVTPPSPSGGVPAFDPPSLSRQRYIIDNNPFSMLRYGALVEISGRF